MICHCLVKIDGNFVETAARLSPVILAIVVESDRKKVIVVTLSPCDSCLSKLVFIIYSQLSLSGHSLKRTPL